MKWLAARLALVGGLTQALVALAVLFLPVLPTYTTNNFDMVAVSATSYVNWGGDAPGYLTLGLMIGVGIITVFVSRKTPTRRAIRLIWLGALLSIGAVAVEAMSFGKLFLPGAIALFMAAAMSRPSKLPLPPQSVESPGSR